MATAKKATAKKAAAATTNTETKEASTRGRKSAYDGKKIIKLVNTEQTTLRASGSVRETWDSIKNGMKVETFRQNAPSGYSLSRKMLADFVAKGWCKVE